MASGRFGSEEFRIRHVGHLESRSSTRSGKSWPYFRTWSSWPKTRSRSFGSTIEGVRLLPSGVPNRNQDQSEAVGPGDPGELAIAA